MRFVQIGDLRHDLHLSIFPSLVSDRRSEPIINLSVYRTVRFQIFICNHLYGHTDQISK